MKIALFGTNQHQFSKVYTPEVLKKLGEYGEISEKINTFETSILPFEDCCTIFVAKHPVTKPNIGIIRRSEENLAEKIDELMAEAISSVETIIVK